MRRSKRNLCNDKIDFRMYQAKMEAGNLMLPNNINADVLVISVVNYLKK